MLYSKFGSRELADDIVFGFIVVDGDDWTVWLCKLMATISSWRSKGVLLVVVVFIWFLVIVTVVLDAFDNVVIVKVDLF